MTTTSIDPAIRELAIRLAKDGANFGSIADETGLLPKEVRLIVDAEKRRMNAPPPPPMPVKASPPLPVGKLAAPGGSYVTVLRAGDLFADHTYQRPVDDRRVEKMVAEYNVALVGIVEVSARPGRYAIVDGQHRWAMLVALDARGNDTPICCRVHQGLTVEQEAALFRDIDKGRRALTTWDRWRARLAAGEADVVTINRTVETLGLRLTDQIKPGTVRAVRSCEEIYQLGGAGLLEQTLATILKAWGDGQDSFTAELLVGVSLILAGFKDADAVRLAEQLSGTTPRQVSARARALRETQSGSLGRLAAYAIVQIYNRGNGSKLGGLPSAQWFSAAKKRPTATGNR